MTKTGTVKLNNKLTLTAFFLSVVLATSKKLKFSMQAGTPLLLISTTLSALPEDVEQPIEFSYDTSEMNMNSGLLALNGSPSEPAVITQGTFRISGIEIIIERNSENINTIESQGLPATFYQVIDAEQPPIEASGKHIFYNRLTGVLDITGDAWLVQGGTRIEAYHFTYDINKRTVRADRSPEGDQVRMVLPPTIESD